jgi:tetratricopeptide (TPR) repeat protein
MFKFKAGFFKIFLVALLAAVVLFIPACGGRQTYRGQSVVQDADEWIRMIGDYRRSVRENPDDQERRVSLKRAELDAAEYFYKGAMVFKKGGKIDEAIAYLEKGLSVMPGNEKVTTALEECVAIRESEIAFKDAMAMKESGNMEEAQKLLEKSLNCSLRI